MVDDVSAVTASGGWNPKNKDTWCTISEDSASQIKYNSKSISKGGGSGGTVYNRLCLAQSEWQPERPVSLERWCEAEPESELVEWWLELQLPLCGGQKLSLFLPALCGVFILESVFSNHRAFFRFQTRLQKYAHTFYCPTLLSPNLF